MVSFRGADGDSRARTPNPGTFIVPCRFPSHPSGVAEVRSRWRALARNDDQTCWPPLMWISAPFT